MPEHDSDDLAAGVAAAIGAPARARILFALLGGRARTSTELAVAADVTASTASIHLRRLKDVGLVTGFAQGKHRFYRLASGVVAELLETLSVVAGTRGKRRTRVPHPLRAARSCYDHLAGRLGVALHDRLQALRWLQHDKRDPRSYELTRSGVDGLAALGIDVESARTAKGRRFAFGCVDWSERRPHLGGALGAALLDRALDRRWVRRDPDSRALDLTDAGRRELRAKFGVSVDDPDP